MKTVTGNRDVEKHFLTSCCKNKICAIITSSRQGWQNSLLQRFSTILKYIPRNFRLHMVCKWNVVPSKRRRDFQISVYGLMRFLSWYSIIGPRISLTSWMTKKIIMTIFGRIRSFVTLPLLEWKKLNLSLKIKSFQRELGHQNRATSPHQTSSMERVKREQGTDSFATESRYTLGNWCCDFGNLGKNLPQHGVACLSRPWCSWGTHQCRQIPNSIKS